MAFFVPGGTTKRLRKSTFADAKCIHIPSASIVKIFASVHSALFFLFGVTRINKTILIVLSCSRSGDENDPKGIRFRGCVHAFAFSESLSAPETNGHPKKIFTSKSV